MKEDVVFTLELHGIQAQIGRLSYRLMGNNRWRLLCDHDDLYDVDFRTASPTEIVAMSPSRETVFELDAIRYRINPAQIRLGDNVLERCSRCFRREFPPVPTREDLRTVLAAGDDGVDQVLVLSVGGWFELREASVFQDEPNDPTVIVRHEVMQAGTGLVGSASSMHDSLVKELYAASLVGWLFHLSDHWTQIQAGRLTGRTERDILRALESLRTRWRPPF